MNNNTNPNNNYNNNSNSNNNFNQNSNPNYNNTQPLSQINNTQEQNIINKQQNYQNNFTSTEPQNNFTQPILNQTNNTITNTTTTPNNNTITNNNIQPPYTQPITDLNKNTTAPQNISPTPITDLTPQPINNISNIPPQNNFQSVEYMDQTNTNDNINTDQELLKAFIGKNYEKITTKKFNLSGFFFTTFYMFYRKMFLYGILIFLINFIILNITNNSAITTAFNVLVGIFVNKIYLYYANKKIGKIKLQNPQKNLNELIEICKKKGGTSIGKIFLGFLAEIGTSIIIIIFLIIIGITSTIGNIFTPDNWNITENKDINDNKDNLQSNKDSIYMENVYINDHSCINTKCTVIIEKDNNIEEFIFNANNIDLFKSLNDYNEYIKVDIYYTENNNELTINDYKIYLKPNNEEINNNLTEEQLRTKIGLYTIGTHTDTFTLSKINSTNIDNIYTNYIFINSKNNTYEMKYINKDKNIDLVEGNKYTITFEVTKDTFGYDFNIKSIN